MSVDVKLPDLGEGIDSGDILNILVAEGDVVRKDQSLLELETEKATVEVPSPQPGRVLKILVARGQTVNVGSVLLSLEAATASGQRPDTTPQPKPAPAAPSAPKATTEPQASEAPRPKAVPKPSMPVEPAITAEVEATDSGSNEPEAIPTPGRRASAVRSRHEGPVPAGPAVRRFAREVGVDLSGVLGSGPGGRITREDVLEIVRNSHRTAKDNGGAADADAHLPGEPAFDDYGPIRREPASKIRKTIAARMHASWSTVPRVTNFDDADVTELEKVRQSSKNDYAASGIKLTTMPFLIKAVSMALRKHPLLNAAYAAEAGEIIYKRYVNIGMAVDSPRGLVVPVLRNTDQLTIAEIARLVAATAERVRSNSFGLDDLRGSTFTISNLGAIGGSYSTPIVNIPEVAILLSGRSRQMPVVVDEELAIRLMMPLSLSYDHRLVDGAAAARFLNEVIAYLEAPSRLLLAP